MSVHIQLFRQCFVLHLASLFMFITCVNVKARVGMSFIPVPAWFTVYNDITTLLNTLPMCSAGPHGPHVTTTWPVALFWVTLHYLVLSRDTLCCSCCVSTNCTLLLLIIATWMPNSTTWTQEQQCCAPPSLWYHLSCTHRCTLDVLFLMLFAMSLVSFICDIV